MGEVSEDLLQAENGIDMVPFAVFVFAMGRPCLESYVKRVATLLEQKFSCVYFVTCGQP